VGVGLAPSSTWLEIDSVYTPVADFISICVQQLAFFSTRFCVPIDRMEIQEFDRVYRGKERSQECACAIGS
jgi:hypothetical protein